MRKLAAAAMLVLMLSGCGERSEMDRVMQLRTDLLAARQCSFQADITADYGDKLWEFSMSCTGDGEGNLDFTMIQPQSLYGIAGRIQADTGKFLFADTMVTFPLLADDQLTPVSAPWIFYRTLRSGYLTSVGKDGQLLRVSIDDSYQDDALRLDIWLDASDTPVRAEILYAGRKILSLDVTDFRLT